MTYYFKMEKKVLKQGCYREDENGAAVYEAKVLKKPLLGPSIYEFVNHAAGTSAQHTVGKTVTLTTEDSLGFYSVKSGFKFDGVNIWKYLHENGVAIDSELAGFHMLYHVIRDGEEIASVSGINTAKCEVTATEENLDPAFLVAFSIARTEQTFYS